MIKIQFETDNAEIEHCKRVRRELTAKLKNEDYKVGWRAIKAELAAVERCIKELGGRV